MFNCLSIDSRQDVTSLVHINLRPDLLIIILINIIPIHGQNKNL